jgi:hypothetical protein
MRNCASEFDAARHPEMTMCIPPRKSRRIGLKTGFRAYELPALACALALIFIFTFSGLPVGLGATLIVATLILRRAGPWWRREKVAPLMAAASA